MPYPPYNGRYPPFDGYKDRKTSPLEWEDTAYPLSPLNVNIQWAYNSTLPAMDIYWDPPAWLVFNGNFRILGVNIYRSLDSEYGPYFRLNDLPLGSTFYRDMTVNTEVLTEDVSGQFLARGRTDEAGKYIFRVQNYPIVKQGTNKELANNPLDVKVYVDGAEVYPARVWGETGEIELRTEILADNATNTRLHPILPREDSVVTCSYYYNTNFVTNTLYQRSFYRITTVGVDQFTGELRETPIHLAEARHYQQMENLDYIWTEAIHRNKWILYQGGERVKLFIRKQVGPVCPCFDQTLGQAKNDCPICFGTSIRGGYEGPYDILVAPPETERNIRQTEIGLRQEMTYETWTGPSPLLSQRDFLVKLNGERFSLGGIRMPTNRGNVLQQHFQIAILDTSDIRYQVPVTGTADLVYPQTRTTGPDEDPTKVDYPQITEKCNIPDEREQRGRTATYENIVY